MKISIFMLVLVLGIASAVVVVRPRPPPVVVRPPPVVVVRPGKRGSEGVIDGSMTKFQVSLAAKTIELTISAQERIVCNVEPRLTGVEVNGLVFKTTSSLSTSENRIELTSTTTLVNPNPIVISIYPNSIDNRSGFMIRERVCYNAFVDALFQANSNPSVQFIIA